MELRAVVVFANGFEDIEGVTPVDVLRRCGVKVSAASLDGKPVRGARGILITPECSLAEIVSLPDAIVLPGGLPGAQHLADDGRLSECVKAMNKEKKLISAICAAPSYALSSFGVLSGKKVTCYPGTEEKLPSDTHYSPTDVICDGNIITSSGPAHALRFSLTIAKELLGPEKANEVAESMLFT